MNDELVAGYLDRIGLPRPATLDADALRHLHQSHQRTVPFENLSIHLGETISLRDDDLLAKVVTRHRGGFCYELNGAFALLLAELGAEVIRVSARVYGAETLTVPFDHMALVVRLPDGTGPWLADVGFGAHSDYPLLLDSRAEQEDPAGRFRLADAPDGDIDVFKDGKPQYRLERRERAEEDFGPTCWYQQTAPESHFRQGTICSLLTADGRITIRGHTLITTKEGDKTEQELPSDEALLAAYRDLFGITLDRVPALPSS
jgi:N-hydroxyarylamine O-acetyltransferase